MKKLVLGAMLFSAAPTPVDACGAFIARSEGLRFNDALQFAVVREGTKTTMTLQNKYRGPSEQFALLVPVPAVLHEGDVKTLAANAFDDVEHTTAPALYDQVERDPCEPEDLSDGMKGGAGAPAGARTAGVTVESQFVVGEYEVATLSATESSGLEKWLTDNGYALPPAITKQLRPYIEEGSKFFVAKVDATKVKAGPDGKALLSPLQFTYDAPELRLPLRLSAANSPGVQDVIVYAFGRGDKALGAANRRNVTMPANVEISREAADHFAEFYASLFARRIGDKRDAVVSEYVNHVYVTPAMRALGLPEGDATWTLSRLHFAVTKDAAEDLVLAEQPMTYTTTSFTYKARWTGAVACKHPHRGRFKPGNGRGGAAIATRDTQPLATPLEQLVAMDVPDLALKTAIRPVVDDDRDDRDDDRPAKTKAKEPKDAKKSGCGCSSDGTPGAGMLALAAVAVLAARRRR